MERRVEPEILDHLAPDDPEGLQSRRELRIINAIMGNHRWLARQVHRHRQHDWRVLELGAGDGALGVRLCNQGEAHLVSGLDLAPRPVGWPEAAGWCQTDVLAVPLP